MINASIDELRKGQMLPEIGGIPDYIWEITDNNNDADQQLLYKELYVLILELPPAYRLVFNLYVIDGYSHAEISKMLNIPVGTSKSNLSRARTDLTKESQKARRNEIMQNIEHDMDELFRKAVDQVPLLPGNSRWNEIAGKLSGSLSVSSAKQKEIQYQKNYWNAWLFSCWALSLPAFSPLLLNTMI